MHPAVLVNLGLLDVVQKAEHLLLIELWGASDAVMFADASDPRQVGLQGASAQAFTARMASVVSSTVASAPRRCPSGCPSYVAPLDSR
jgi:hypothetical protein